MFTTYALKNSESETFKKKISNRNFVYEKCPYVEVTVFVFDLNIQPLLYFLQFLSVHVRRTLNNIWELAVQHCLMVLDL